MKNKKNLGNLAEKLALYFLLLKGYKIITKNYRNREFEIDIIAKLNNDLFFCEVKSCKNCNIDILIDKIDLRKISKIKKGAMHFLVNYKEKYDNIFFSVIFIQFMPFKFIFIKDAF